MGMFLRRGPAPKIGTPIGSLAVGQSIKLNVETTPWEFLIVHQGLPSDIYDASCDGTWLLMKDIYEMRKFNSISANDYTTSEANAYLNDTFPIFFDIAIQNAIKRVKIPYCVGGGKDTIMSGADGLSCKIFLLGCYELGYSNSDNAKFPVDGAKLDYFTAGTTADARAPRIAYLNGVAKYWWLRSPVNTSDEIAISNQGSSKFASYYSEYGIRPAFILPSDFLVTDDMLA